MNTLLSKSLPVACALSLAMTACAACGQPQDTPPPGPPPGARNPQFEAALDECRQSLGIAADQRPDPAKMETCLTAKGFPKPKNGPHRRPPMQDGAQPPPPPSGDTP